MVDIRERVEDSRGVLKKIQLLIPGYAGYRSLEDVREADNYLRIQIANMLHDSLNVLQNTRKALVDRGIYSNLSIFGTVISKLQELEGAVRHAQQGYSGISPAIRIGKDNLDKLYDYDYSFVSKANDLKNSVNDLYNNVLSNNLQNVYEKIQNIIKNADDFYSAFNDRMVIIQNIKVD